jgi:hypothetical protein
VAAFEKRVTISLTGSVTLDVLTTFYFLFTFYSERYSLLDMVGKSFYGMC